MNKDNKVIPNFKELFGKNENVNIDKSDKPFDFLSEDEKYNKCIDIASKTIGYDIEPMKFEDIGKNINNLLQRYTNGKMSTNGVSGLDGKPIIAKIKK